jgi:DNA-binding protein YbaB
MNHEEQIAALTQAASYLTSVVQAIQLTNDALKRVARQDLLLAPEDAEALKENLDATIAELMAEREAENRDDLQRQTDERRDAEIRASTERDAAEHKARTEQERLPPDPADKA